MSTAGTELVTTTHVELGTAARPVLIRWCSRRASGGGATFDSYALLTGDGPVLVEPRLPAPPADAPVWDLLGAPPVATLVTNDWHERSCYAVRERWGTPVWAPAAGLRERGGELDGRPDHPYEAATPLPGGVRAHKIDGVFAGEHVLDWVAPSGERVLFAGDTLRAQVGPDHPDLERWGGPPALYLGSSYQYVEWIPDPERLRASLRRLLAEAGELALLCCGHSPPYRDHARDALAQLVAFDWRPVLLAGGRPVVYTRLLEKTDRGRRQSFPLVVRAR